MIGQSLQKIRKTVEANGHDVQEIEWMRRTKDGDHAAFRALYSKYCRLVFSYSLFIVKSRHLAEEAVQEVFSRVWEKRENLRDDSSFKAYVCTIAKNYLLNQLRKASYDAGMREQVFYSRAKADISGENSLLENELEGFRERAFKSLPAERKKIFLLSYEQGLKHKEIARALGISQNTVKDQIVKAHKDIKTFLMKHAGIAFTSIFSLFLGA